MVAFQDESHTPAVKISCSQTNHVVVDEATASGRTNTLSDSNDSGSGSRSVVGDTSPTLPQHEPQEQSLSLSRQEEGDNNQVRLPSALRLKGALSQSTSSASKTYQSSRTSQPSSVASASNGGGRSKGGSGNFNSSTGSMSGDTRSSKSHTSVLEPARRVFYGRYLFVLFLMGSAALLGYLAYRLMNDAEDQIASERFESISERALSTAQLVIEEKKKATDSLALMMGTANPDPEQWPNVYMEGYSDIASSLRVITEGSLSFCPIVVPGGEEQTSFEAFAYDLFHNISGYPNTTGVSAFGKGVFSYGQGEFGNETWPDGRFHIQSGWTYHMSPRNVLVPFIQSDYGAHGTLMLNVHFEHNRAAAIDNSISCSENRAQTLDEDMECGSITDLMWSETAADVDPGPAGLMMVPIYPRNDKQKLTGFIVGKQIWSDLLKHGFESDVNGLDVVLRTENKAHTYRIYGGEAIYLSPGDTHDPHARYSAVGTHINPRYFSNTTVKYYMDIYSTEEFTQSYSTTNPRVACIGAVLIIAFTSIVFFLFDYFVRKEFHDKKKLLEAKRQFVRFVSHEVRTPLNTVCMGLTLLSHELASVLGVKAPIAHSAPNGSPPGSHTQNTLSTLDEEKVREWMVLCTQIFENADEAVAVLSDLLNYDKIQMGTLTLELSLMNPWAAIEKTVNEFTLAAYEKGVSMKLDLSLLRNGGRNDKDVEWNDMSSIPIDLKFCKIVADNVRLSQVLRNLLSNGLKFSNEQGNLDIRISAVSFPKRKQKEESFSLHNVEDEVELVRYGWLVVEIIDDGVGMTPEQVATVFDDGTQFNANKFQAGGGSGLGLNIAKGIVKEHGGKLTCSSEGLGLGSTFCLSLPLYNPKDEACEGKKNDSTSSPEGDTKDTRDAESSREGEHDDGEFGLPHLRMLVVDDAVTNRKLCMRLLQRSGHTCDGACDGVEAVAMVKKSMKEGKPYDCILLDYEMPNMDGPEACQLMRKHGCSSYIAGVTGNLLTEDVDHFRSCGANWVLPKPFRLEALEEQLIEDGFGTNLNDKENGYGDDGVVVRVNSSGALVDMGDELALSLRETADTSQH